MLVINQNQEILQYCHAVSLNNVATNDSDEIKDSPSREEIACVLTKCIYRKTVPECMNTTNK